MGLMLCNSRFEALLWQYCGDKEIDFFLACVKWCDKNEKGKSLGRERDIRDGPGINTRIC